MQCVYKMYCRYRKNRHKNTIIFKMNMKKKSKNLIVENFEAKNCSNISRGVSSNSIRYYDEKEDKAILDFIVTSRRFSEVNGNALWIAMELKNIVPNRSWQSMKNRLIQYIALKLENFRFLNSDDVCQLKKYLGKASKQIEKQTHENRQVDQIRCIICNFNTTNVTSLKLHMRAHVEKICVICEHVCKNALDRRNHMSAVHGSN